METKSIDSGEKMLKTDLGLKTYKNRTHKVIIKTLLSFMNMTGKTNLSRTLAYFDSITIFVRSSKELLNIFKSND